MKYLVKVGEHKPEHLYMRDNFPKVTVITVTYNSGTTLRKTFESVANQSYKNIEYIVIDGGSNDDTLRIIAEYGQYISYWVSEPDKGIYNAMNKGIDHATGKLVYFLNADDYFYDNHTIEDVAKAYSRFGCPDVIYGDVMTYSASRRSTGRSGRNIGLSEVKKGRVICHQAIFMRKKILEKYRFNEEYRIAADYELQVKCLKDRHRFVYMDRIIAYYCIDGLSSSLSGKRDTVYEKMRIIQSHFGPVTFYRFYIFAQMKLLRMSARQALRGLFHQEIRNNDTVYIGEDSK